jgi:hypothetical protein
MQIERPRAANLMLGGLSANLPLPELVGKRNNQVPRADLPSSQCVMPDPRHFGVADDLGIAKEAGPASYKRNKF